jgi:hypothetical protein
MRLIVVFLNVMPVYVMTYEMNEWISNDIDRTVAKYVFNTFVGMTLWSYAIASFVKPAAIP